MPNNFGRDQIWTPDIWAAIDKAVVDEVGSIRVVQKVFGGMSMPNSANVPAVDWRFLGDIPPWLSQTATSYYGGAARKCYA
jgi:hypothetical protein